LFTGHLWKNLFPAKGDLSWRVFSIAIANHLQLPPAEWGQEPGCITCSSGSPTCS
jgi:hypothetical protein